MKAQKNLRAAGKFRENALNIIQDYIATTNWTPVFEFQPRMLILSTPITGGEVNYEGQSTGGSPLVINLEVPELRTIVRRDDQGPYIVMRCVRPGLWFSPHEETHFNAVVHSKTGITSIRGSGKNRVIQFHLPIVLDPFDYGLDKLSDKHLKMMYEDIIKECPELAASTESCVT